MGDKITTTLQKSMYIALTISFVDKHYLPDIKIKKSIGENGVCNIENVGQYWDRISYKNEEFKPKSNRIQISINRYDLSIRLIHPHSSIWSFTNHIYYFEEDEEKDFKKTSYKNEGEKMWLAYAGSTADIRKEGAIYVYPNKIKISFKLKEKIGCFINEVKEKIKKPQVTEQQFIKEKTITMNSKHNKVEDNDDTSSDSDSSVSLVEKERK